MSIRNSNTSPFPGKTFPLPNISLHQTCIGPVPQSLFPLKHTKKLIIKHISTETLAMNESKEDGHPVSRYFTTQILLRATLSKVVLSNAFCWVNLPCRMWAHYFLAFEAPRMYCTNEMKEKSKEIMNSLVIGRWCRWGHSGTKSQCME